ncbi:MAG: aminoglycoside phosphotransferase family protein [Oscillospiraceae bacterium]|nr:aminoglycoside phosphotransferase family protein [Oscillospiraceae bacterium]MBR4655137.1 aminoglycoside phosphotransferase family protein [Oscillospiraceae bacterium]
MQQAIHHFQIMSQPVFCRNFGHGNINYTFLITTDNGKQYILQRINTHVFKKPVELMENVIAVTQHIREKVDDPAKVLNFVPALDGKYYYRDERKRFWRCYEFVGGFCLEAPETDADFYESAVAFGRFQEQLSDFPAETLHETIPNFHNTPDRYRQLHIAMDEDACDRLQYVQREVDFILEREQEAGTIQRMLESGELPLRVTHNDTKLNNVLLDMRTRKALCVLDLDTVMPGSSLFDFGDSIRFGAATAPEDVQELSRMTLDLHRFEVYTKGYLDGCHALSKREIELLPLGAKIITLELAVRFLTDYLESDHYFKTQYSDHNLVRCRAQLKLVQDMEAKWYQMQKIVENYVEK